MKDNNIIEAVKKKSERTKKEKGKNSNAGNKTLEDMFKD
mgnify:CR=1 FL=1